MLVKPDISSDRILFSFLRLSYHNDLGDQKQKQKCSVTFKLLTVQPLGQRGSLVGTHIDK